MDMPTASPPSGSGAVDSGLWRGQKRWGGNRRRFSFCDLGQPLLIGENLNEEVSPEKTGIHLVYGDQSPYAPPAGENAYHLGSHNHTAYYFYYEPQRITVLDYAFLPHSPKSGDGMGIYADRCAIGEESWPRWALCSRKIPRDITRL